jgi:hypothetical protein
LACRGGVTHGIEGADLEREVEAVLLGGTVEHDLLMLEMEMMKKLGRRMIPLCQDKGGSEMTKCVMLIIQNLGWYAYVGGEMNNG